MITLGERASRPQSAGVSPRDDSSHARRPTAAGETPALGVADLLEQNANHFATLITSEMRKPIRQSRAEIAKCVDTIRFFAANAPDMLRDEPVGPNAFIRYEPLGTILGVMPWNFPFWQVIRFAIPALIAGNSVIVKHSSLVPRCADALNDIFSEAGYGEDFTAASLPHSAVEPLIERVQAIVVTAGEETGRYIASLAGRHLRKVILELGGSDAFIVMPSADLDVAVATAVRSRLHCNGQACTAAKRFILHEEIAAAFEERFVAAMESVRCGDPFDEQTDLGPLATSEIAARLDRQVAMTVMAGAQLLAGGYRITGNFYAPTVLASVPLDSPAAQEETFGPVAALFRVRSLSDAIELANNTRYGLDATVWTRDSAERERFIAGLRVGQVFVNKIASSHPALPFGGTKDSGYGRELGVAGVRELTHPKSVSY